MDKVLKVVYFALVAAALAIPSLSFFGAREDWTKLAGWEKNTNVAPFTFANWTNRTFQTSFTEDFSKNFFMRKTLLRTSLELWDVLNLRTFHHGYRSSILDGRDGVLFEKPYVKFHLEADRSGDTNKYASVMKKIKELDAFCRSIGADFVFMPMADKPQAYSEYLPGWLDWFFDYSNYDAQGALASLCRANGIKTFDACNYLLSRKKEWKEWVYPPGGTHFNAYGMGLVYEGFAGFAATNLENRLTFNRFRGVHRIEPEWSVDDDISRLLNIWYNPRLGTNPHFAPEFDAKGVANDGSAFVLGDCYREQIVQIFKDAQLFAPKKILASKRVGQKAQDLGGVIKDLKLVVLTFQSFNAGRMDAREAEIESICAAMREARKSWSPPCRNSDGLQVSARGLTPAAEFASILPFSNWGRCAPERK